MKYFSLKELRKLAESKNKELLIESFSAIINPKDIEIKSKPVLIESKGNEYECRGILRRVPVTKYTENLNSRVYPLVLWEGVKKSGMFEGSLALADHPEDDGSVSRISGVWRNFTVENDQSYADFYAVGDLGSLLIEVVKAGGAVGFSTVGFGEFLEDNKTIDPDTYEYLRTDWVLDPSQQVFGTLENFESVQENIQSEECDSEEEEEEEIEDGKVILTAEPLINKGVLESKNTNKHSKVNTLKEETAIMDKITESSLRNVLKAQITQAKKLDNLFEAKESIASLEIPDVPEFKDLKERAEKEIEIIETKIAETVASATKTAQDLSESKVDLEAKLQTAEGSLKEAKEENQKLKQVIDASTKSSKTVNEAAKVYERNSVIMSKDIKQLVEDKSIMQLDINQLLKDRKVQESDIKKLLKDRKVQEADIKKLLKDRKVQEADINKLKKLVKKYAEMAGVNVADMEDPDLVGDNYDVESEVNMNDGSTDQVMINPDTIGNPYDPEVPVYDGGSTQNMKNPDSIGDDFEIVNSTMEIEPLESITGDEIEAAPTATDAFTYSYESAGKTRVNPHIKKAINEYFKSVVAKNPSVKAIFKEVLNSKNIKEAIAKVEAFTAKKSEKVTLVSEASKLGINKNGLREDWLGPRL